MAPPICQVEKKSGWETSAGLREVTRLIVPQAGLVLGAREVVNGVATVKLVILREKQEKKKKKNCNNKKKVRHFPA